MSEATINKNHFMRVMVVALFLSTAVIDTAQAARREKLARLGDDFSGSVNVTIKGIIVAPPPCTINNNQTIDVDFGDAVDINKVDGKNYRQDVSYTLECSGASSNSMTLSIVGTAIEGFDDGAALDAGHGGLGIELEHEGNKVVIGKAINFTWPDYPMLKAVPVKKPGTTLDSGAFSVGATMIVSWQ